MNYLQLCQQLRREVGTAGSGSIPSAVTSQTGMNEKLVNWIADACYQIESLHWDWNFLWSQFSVATVAGNAEPTVPVDLGVWDEDSFYLNYTLATNKKLSKLDYRQWRATYRQGVQTNRKPSFVVVKPDNQIRLHPAPDDAYTLTADYWARPTRLSANTDEPAIPEQFQRCIVVLAKIYFAEEEEIPSLMQAASMELYGVPGRPGLLAHLESHELPDQKGRMMGAAPSITVRPA